MKSNINDTERKKRVRRIAKVAMHGVVAHSVQNGDLGERFFKTNNFDMSFTECKKMIDEYLALEWSN